MRRIIAFVLGFTLAAAAAAQERYFDSGGVRIRYLDAGAGAPVVLIHGFTGDIERSWIGTGVLDGLKDGYRIEKAHMVGYSLGGIIVLKLLTTHPQRFLSAVVGGAAYRRARSNDADAATEAAAREIAASSDVLAHAALMRARRALLVSDAEMAAVRVPTLAVVGALDPALPRVQAMRKRWPRVEVEVVPGATHPTVHERGLPRHPAFLAAIRQRIAQ